MKRTLLSAGGALALVAGLMAAAAPAQANPKWELYDVTNGAKVAVGDIVTGAGKLVFRSVIDGQPVEIECQARSGLFSYTVGTGDQLGAGPGADLEIGIVTDDVLSVANEGSDLYDGNEDKLGVCQDVSGPVSYPNGARFDVTTSGAALTLTIEMPDLPANIPAGDKVQIATDTLYTGILGTDGPGGLGSATLTVPAGAVTFWDPGFGWGGTGPNYSTALTGSYHAGTGVLSADPGQPLTVTPVPPITISSTRLYFASLQLDPQLSVIY